MDINVFRHFNRDTNEIKYDMPSDLPQRRKDGWVTSGKELAVKVNSYTITKWPGQKIHQYDVSCTSPNPSYSANSSPSTSDPNRLGRRKAGPDQEGLGLEGPSSCYWKGLDL